MKTIPRQRTASPGITSPGITSPGITSPGITSPGITSPGIAEVTRLTPRPTPGVVPLAVTQGTLALELDHFSGMPPAPDLQMVRGGLGSAESWAARFAQAVIEVIAGDRSPNQLVRCTSPSVHADLLHRATVLNQAATPEQRRRKLRAQVCSVHVFSPSAQSAELSVHVRQGQRSRALAARIERLDGRWICVALEFG